MAAREVLRHGARESGWEKLGPSVDDVATGRRRDRFQSDTHLVTVSFNTRGGINEATVRSVTGGMVLEHLYPVTNGKLTRVQRWLATYGTPN